MYESFPPSGRSYVAFKPQVYSDITDVLTLKIQSLKAHKSQYKKYGEMWIDAVIGRAQLRGWECGNKYAECFELLRSDLIL
jgi:LmbE family N-acetylglucosaminyl deacetylase